MTTVVTRRLALYLIGASTLPARAADGPGHDAGEIRIGNMAPYSGPASSYGIIARTERAYFDMINERGGINGRKVRFISYDDGYSPPKAIEQARRLVESDEVLAIFQAIGTPSNAAIQKYMNTKKVPQLFVGSGASRFSDPKTHPWTVGFNPTYETETEVYGKYILAERPDAKVAIIYQNDDSGRDQIKGLERGLGARAATMIVARASYEPTDPVVDSQILKLKSSGADVLVSLGTPRAGSQTIRKVAEIGWKPLFFVGNPQASVAAVLVPAGRDNAKGVISSTAIKDVTDPTWKDDADVIAYRAFMARYYPDGDIDNGNNAYGYVAAQLMAEVLRRCGDDLSRENVLHQATSLDKFRAALLLPGITISTSSTNHKPLRQLQLIRFDGERWRAFGDVISED